VRGMAAQPARAIHTIAMNAAHRIATKKYGENARGVLMTVRVRCDSN